MIKLKGKTRHGKNRIAQHGEWWTVCASEGEDAMFRGEPAWMLRSLERTDRGDNDVRWVLKKNDPNFEVLIVE